jgi:hypothetical protein
MKEDTLKILVDTLKYYANKDTWTVDVKTYMSPAGKDLGAMARLALSIYVEEENRSTAVEKELFRFKILGYNIVPVKTGWLIRYQKDGYNDCWYMGTAMYLTDALEASKTAFVNEDLARISLKNYLNKKGIKVEN